MKVGIIGCGFVGQKRAKALTSDCQLVACADVQFEKAQQLATQTRGCQAFTHWQDIISHPEINIVIIATPHNVLAEICHAAVLQHKHVLIEKPAARSVNELLPVITVAKKHKVYVHVGFNHRYHRAFQKARTLVDQGEIGELMFVRARYGHGGRIGYDKEWRAISAISGGGELIDQGVHLIDLARWFLGEFIDIQGFAPTYFWDMPVDDNAFLLLKTTQAKVAFLHASCTEWKNLFSFEIYGKSGKLAIEGLGGSYGTEKLTFYKMLPMMGPPETICWEYPMPDNSWEIEFAEFLQDIKNQQQTTASLYDAVAALKVVEEIYQLPKKIHKEMEINS